MTELPSVRSLFRSLTDEGIPVLTEERLSRHTTFHIGGCADLTVLPPDRETFTAVLRLWRQEKDRCPLLILGKGSNVLPDDRGFRGLVVLTGLITHSEFSPCLNQDGSVSVYADCGVPLTALARACTENGRSLAGLSFAFGIPGSVGGAAVMNAGAYGGDMASVVQACDVLDLASGQIYTISRENLDFSYRHSVFSDHPELVVLGVHLTLQPGDKAQIDGEMTRHREARRQSQPLEWPNAGSVFKRPATGYMGQMIEACHLKGYTVGGAQVSEKHAGFIINTGHATAADVRTLIRHIQEVIYRQYGFIPCPEIRILNEGTTLPVPDGSAAD